MLIDGVQTPVEPIGLGGGQLVLKERHKRSAPSSRSFNEAHGAQAPLERPKHSLGSALAWNGAQSEPKIKGAAIAR